MILMTFVAVNDMKDYQIATVPGISPVTRQELDELGALVVRTDQVRSADILSVQASDASRLLELRTAEDVFATLARVRLTGGVGDMRTVAGLPAWMAALRRVVAEWSHAAGKPVVKRQVFRVVVQADDVAWRHYRRNELMLAAERGIMTAQTSWRLNRDVAPLEIWLQQSGHELLVSLRLSTAEMRQHGGRTQERTAALRPSVAAAMVRLTKPREDDVFLDPMCGSGTILLERAQAGRYELLIGGDKDPEAVAATLANFGPRHQPRQIERMDATDLPFRLASVTAMATNLPWGRQISEQAALPELYAGVLREAVRVLVPGSRLVLLTSEWDLLRKAMTERPELKLEQTLTNVVILGRRADIFGLIKAN
jgi:tRNA (guanine6-N2)-methyltransferase